MDRHTTLGFFYVDNLFTKSWCSSPVPIALLLKAVHNKTRMVWSLEQILVEIEEYHAGGAGIHVDVTVE
jgi:hypothetical protein